MTCTAAVILSRSRSAIRIGHNIRLGRFSGRRHEFAKSQLFGDRAHGHFSAIISFLPIDRPTRATRHRRHCLCVFSFCLFFFFFFYPITEFNDCSASYIIVIFCATLFIIFTIPISGIFELPVVMIYVQVFVKRFLVTNFQRH